MVLASSHLKSSLLWLQNFFLLEILTLSRLSYSSMNKPYDMECNDTLSNLGNLYAKARRARAKISMIQVRVIWSFEVKVEIKRGFRLL